MTDNLTGCYLLYGPLLTGLNFSRSLEYGSAGEDRELRSRAEAGNRA